MYIVVELYDGEVNIDICANIESALYKKKEYIDMYGDPYGIFTNDPTLDNRDTVEKFITVPIEFREGDE